MKLKYIRYFGRFYEVNGQLGWMPWHKALYTQFLFWYLAKNDIPTRDGFKWVRQSSVKINKKR